MNQLIFLPVPESFISQLNNAGETFPINPDIPIPVEIPENSDKTILSNLTIDMIIYGMLRAIEEKDIKQEWKDYYSGFVLFMRPDILEICQEEMNKEPVERNIQMT
jgi:hypothetical protein